MSVLSEQRNWDIRRNKKQKIRWIKWTGKAIKVLQELEECREEPGDKRAQSVVGGAVSVPSCHEGRAVDDLSSCRNVSVRVSVRACMQARPRATLRAGENICVAELKTNSPHGADPLFTNRQLVSYSATEYFMKTEGSLSFTEEPQHSPTIS
jgi:hypothetical protein